MTPYQYVSNNPIHYVDPDGRSPILPNLYAFFEAGMSIYDAYDTAKTLFFDDDATNFKNSVTLSGFGIGFVASGGGYGKLAREGAQLIGEQTIKEVVI